MVNMTFRYGANFKIVGKCDPQKLSYAGAWDVVEGTFRDLAAHISKGYPWMPAVLDGNRKRWQSNANQAEVLAIDVDNGLTIQEFLENPLAKYCGLGIESASSKPEHHKFRAVFRYPKPVQGWERIRICQRYMMTLINVADPACKDASRFFFGAPGREAFLLNEDARLPEDFIDQAVAWAQEQERIEQVKAEESRRQWQAELEANPDRDEKGLILDALRYADPDCSYEQWTGVGMTLVGLFGSEGVDLWHGWTQGCTRPDHAFRRKECHRRARTFRNPQPRIGQLIKLAKEGGFRFPSHAQHRPANSLSQQQQKIKAEQRQACEDRIAEKQRWLNGLDLEPTTIVTDRYMPQGRLPEGGGIVLGAARTNTGKTFSFLRGFVLHQAEIAPDGKIMLIGSRNSLQRQTMAVFGGRHHTEFTSDSQMLASRWWAMCFDSIMKIDPSKITEGSILMLDEISHALSHAIAGSTVGDCRGLILDRFAEIVRTVIAKGGWIIGSEDSITNVELEVLKGSVPEAPIYYTKSEWQGDPRDVSLYKTPGQVLQLIVDALKAGKKVAVPSDSRKFLRDLEGILLKQGIPQEKIKILDRESSHEPWAKEIAENPDDWFSRNDTWVFGFSPSIENGLSIAEDWFDEVDFYFCGTLEPRFAIQMPIRYRPVVPWNGCIKKSVSGVGSSDPDALLSDYRKNAEGIAILTELAVGVAAKGGHDDVGQVVQRLLSDDESLPEAQWLKHRARIEARRNHGLKNLRSSIIEIWEARGYRVTEVESQPSEMKAIRKEVRQEIDGKESIALAIADPFDMSLNEAHQVLENDSASKEDRILARKRILQDRLPNCPLDDPDWLYRVVVSDNGKKLQQTSLLWAALNPKQQAELDGLWLSDQVKRTANRNSWMFAADLKAKSLQGDLLHRLGIAALLEAINDGWWDDNTPAVAEFAKACRWSNREIYRILRLNCTEDQSNSAIARKVLRKLGYEFEESRPGTKTRERHYRIVNLQDIDREQVLTALSEKANRKLGQESEVTSNICTNNKPLQNLDVDPQWFTSESLEDVRSWLESAQSDPKMLRELRQMVPASVLEFVLGRQDCLAA